ncbi:hypothetical protein AU255_15305 [Methyloprofundus sedimenti]|uniref:Uncharacterized protein n=1 Tax=Methyloprofundus sedimenti TaxID=1420851 RepID=A0A1V8M252_9GAMM|nr:hypothetical protein AU255_15305 [Methyloprofundus sedimenti]
MLRFKKKWTDETEIICWHFDHCKGLTVKGINLLNALCFNDDISIPVAFEIVRKPTQYGDIATRKIKRSSTFCSDDIDASYFNDVLIMQRIK